MSEMDEKNCTQVMICGSGCAGSLLAWILAQQGMDVVLVDRGQHPRFAIGESSTPLADFQLERLAQLYALPQLAPLARWGTWKKNYPHLQCGKKRGFSYFGHRSNARFSDDLQHSHSLLVAASASDEMSDTHWLRSDVDGWLYDQAQRAGAIVREGTEIEHCAHDDGGWSVTLRREEGCESWRVGWMVDATGAGGVIPRSQEIQRCDDQLATRTGSLFGHFENVKPMTQWLVQEGFDTSSDPFDADDAAQHHVMDDGWMWMLRFDSGLTSVGITRPTKAWEIEGIARHEPKLAWQQVLDRYPTLADLLCDSRLVAPSVKDESGIQVPRMGWIPRISRLWSFAAGERWLALPSTVGVIDPLHSTGLAHALSGVERAAEILLREDGSWRQRALVDRYRRQVVDEVKWIDQLVAICYAALPDFDLFTAVCSFYFIAAIECEHELSTEGKMSNGFLGAACPAWRELVPTFTEELASGTAHASDTSRAKFIDRVRRSIEPWNRAALLSPHSQNRFARTAAAK